MDIVNNFKKQAVDAVLALGTPKLMLLDENHTTNVDTQAFIDDVSANEISSAGYTAGGVTLANVTSVIDTANDKVTVDADDASWQGLTATVKAAVLYVDTGTPATSPIVGIVTFGTNQVLVAQDFNTPVNEEGLADWA